MTNIFARTSRLALAAIVPTWLLAVPVTAQENKAPAAERAQERGQERAAPAPAPASNGGSSGGGAHAGGSAGGSDGGGRHFGGSDGGGRHSSGGGNGSNGASGIATPRGGDRDSSGARAGGASGGTRATGGPSTNGSSGERGRANPRGAGQGEGRLPDDGVPAYARPREGKPVVGTAVPRTSLPPSSGGGGVVVIPTGYYGGYYDPWWYSGFGYGGYSGYYGGYYDPWYGAYPSYPQASGSYEEGALRLKIKPREAEVYVDGYYAGIVDDFDGIFQRLHIESGPHRIEVRAPGYETLTFDVRITPDHSTTYQGEMKKIP